MSEVVNPYEHRIRARASVTPRKVVEPAQLHVDSNVGPWRDGKLLVMHKASPMPDRCIKTNEPTEGYRKKLKLKNDTPGSPHRKQAIAGLFGVFGLVLAGVISNTLKAADEAPLEAVVHVGLSPRCRRRRRNIIIAGFLSMFSCGLYSYLANQHMGRESPDLWCFVALLIVTVITSSLSTVVKIKRIDGDYIWLSGAGRDFLDTLPSWPD